MIETALGAYGAITIKNTIPISGRLMAVSRFHVVDDAQVMLLSV
jgi:hypothetical protein